MDSIGRRIKKLRGMRGLTQNALAEKLGIHPITIQSYEQEVRKPKDGQAEKLAQALEVDPAFLNPTATDTPMAMFAVLFDLMDVFGDINIQNNGGKVTFGVNDPMINIKLQEALKAHEELDAEAFKQWLINYPHKIHNGEIE